MPPTRAEVMTARGLPEPARMPPPRSLPEPRTFPQHRMPPMPPRVDVFVAPRKEHRACCTSRRDRLGRLPIGFCSPDCEGRNPAHRERTTP